MLEKEHNLPTTSWWLGAEECHVELNCTNISENVLNNVEQRCNELISAAIPVNVKFCKANDPDLDEVRIFIRKINLISLSQTFVSSLFFTASRCFLYIAG